MNPQRLLEQFLGPQTNGAMKGKLQSAATALSTPGAKAGLAGLAAGGLLGLLAGSKKTRKIMGGIVGYGGAAALGAFAHRAYRKWQDQKPPTDQALPGGAMSGSVGHSASEASAPDRFSPSAAPASDGQPFELALVKAMIAAANADGHICEEERQAIVAHLSTLNLDVEDKSLVFDALFSPPPLAEIAQLANGVAQASEIYLVSRMLIDPDNATERAYIDALARCLALPPTLVLELESQVSVQMSLAA